MGIMEKKMGTTIYGPSFGMHCAKRPDKIKPAHKATEVDPTGKILDPKP